MKCVKFQAYRRRKKSSFVKSNWITILMEWNDLRCVLCYRYASFLFSSIDNAFAFTCMTCANTWMFENTPGCYVNCRTSKNHNNSTKFNTRFSITHSIDYRHIYESVLYRNFSVSLVCCWAFCLLFLCEFLHWIDNGWLAIQCCWMATDNLSTTHTCT